MRTVIRPHPNGIENVVLSICNRYLYLSFGFFMRVELGVPAMKETFLAVAFGLLLSLGMMQAQTIVRIAPPPPPRVVVPVSPGPRYVWVGERLQG